MKRITIGISVLLAVGVGAALWLRAGPGAAADPTQLQTVPVQRGTVALTVSADGVLEPLTTVAVKSYAGGRVDVLAVDVGDRVEIGDLIAKIDPTDSLTAYDQARADLAAAQAGLTRARREAQVQPTLTQASIAQAEAGYDSAVKDLERLQQATQPQAEAQARATLDKAAANLEIAEKELARVQGLKARGFVPQSDVDTAVNRRDLAKAEIASAQERWDTLNQEQAAELEAARAKVAQAKAGLDKARADAVQDQLREVDVHGAQAQVTRAQAQVENTSTTLGYTTITAPRAGVILERFIEEGTIVTSGRSSVAQGTDIVVLGDLTQMFVEVSLDEADVGLVRAGQPVGISIDAFPDEPFRGVVTRINPQAVTQQNITTVLVRVEIENADARLKPGMTASCDFMVDRVDDVLYLPSRAVQQAGGSHFVTIRQGAESVQVPVEVGLAGDDRTEIVEGLSEGTTVLLPSLTGESRESGDQMGRSGPPGPPGGVGSFFRGGR